MTEITIEMKARHIALTTGMSYKEAVRVLREVSLRKRPLQCDGSCKRRSPHGEIEVEVVGPLRVRLHTC